MSSTQPHNGGTNTPTPLPTPTTTAQPPSATTIPPMMTATTTTPSQQQQHLGMLILETDGRSFVPGDDVWVTVRIKMPVDYSGGTGTMATTRAMGVRGSVALVGEERTQLPGGWAG